MKPLTRHHRSRQAAGVPGNIISPAIDTKSINVSGAFKSSDYWEKAGRKQALRTFKLAADRVPAYRDFLEKNEISPKAIRTFEDFKKLPLINKQNYIFKYSLPERCLDGNIANGNIFSVSSGSTGEPQYWSKDQSTDIENEWLFELVFKNVFNMASRKTLLLSAFSLGTWVAGTSMFELSIRTSNRGYPLVVVATGISVPDILKTASTLGPLYDQVILAGYPPFIKDAIEEGLAQGVNWRKLNMKFVFGGEAVTEPWRDYLLKLTGSKDPLMDTSNLFGTAEGGAMGVETPPAISLKRLAYRDPALSRRLFKSERMPAIYQYNPTMRFFETVEDQLVFSMGGAMPLVRYDLLDNGGVIRRDELNLYLKNNSSNLFEGMAAGNYAEFDYNLPFVYLFGRPHNNATIYSVNIYPENIKAVLEDTIVAKKVSGKFKISTEYSPEMDQYLLLRVELARRVRSSQQLQDKIKSLVTTKVPGLNSEYKRLLAEIGDKALPHIELLEHGDPIFRPGNIKVTNTIQK